MTVQKEKELAKQKEKQKEEDKQKEDEKRKEKEKELERERQQALLNRNPEPYAFDSWKELPLTLEDSGSSYSKIKSINEMFKNKELLTFNLDSDLFVSRNFRNSIKSEEDTLGSNFLKPVNFFMVIKDPKTQKLKAMIITQDEATEFKAFITKDREKLLKEGYEVWIKSTHDKLFAGTSRTIHHPNYNHLLQQIQYFNGDIDQIQQQKELHWFFNEMEDKLYYLKNTILKNHPHKKKFLHLFTNTLESEYKKFQETSMLHLNALYQSIASGDIKKLNESLQFLKEIKNTSLRSAIVNNPMIPDKPTLLKEAIQEASKHGNLAIVEPFLNINELKIDAESRIALFKLAIQYNNLDFFQILLQNKNILPKRSEDEEWKALAHKILQTNQDEFVLPFFTVMKKNWYNCEYAFAQPLLPDISRLPLEEAKNTLLKLEKLYDEPEELWIKYFHYFVENRKNDEILALIQSWYQSPPSHVLGGLRLGGPKISELISKKDIRPGRPPRSNNYYRYLKILMNVKTLDVFLTLLKDPIFGLPNDDVDGFNELFYSYSTDPESGKIKGEIIEFIIKNFKDNEIKALVTSSQFKIQVERDLSNVTQGQGQVFHSHLLERMLKTFEIFPDPFDFKSRLDLADTLLNIQNEQAFIQVFKKISQRKNQNVNEILSTMLKLAFNKYRLEILEHADILPILLQSETLIQTIVKEAQGNNNLKAIMPFRKHSKAFDKALMEAAVKSDNWNIMNTLYDEYNDASNKTDSDFIRPFYPLMMEKAYRDKKWDMVEKLYLNRIPTVQIPESILETLLIRAVINKNLSLATQLLKDKVNPNLKNSDNDSLLRISINNFDENMFRLLLKYEANLEDQLLVTGYRYSGGFKKKIVEIAFGFPYSYQRSRAEYAPFARIILEHMGDKNFNTYEGSLEKYQLSIAKNFDINTLKVLIKLGLIDQVSLDNIYRAAIHEKQYEMLSFLLQSYPNLKQVTINYVNAVEYATQLQDEKLIHFLIEQGIPLEQKEYTIKNIILNGYMTALQALLDRRLFDPTEYMRDNNTWLNLAITSGHENIVKLLLDHGVSSNQTKLVRESFYFGSPSTFTPFYRGTQATSANSVPDWDDGLSQYMTPKEQGDGLLPPSATPPKQDDGIKLPGYDDSEAGAPLELLRTKEAPAELVSNADDEPPLEDSSFDKQKDESSEQVQKTTQKISILYSSPDPKDTPLILAIRKQRLDIAELLIKAHADLDATNSQGKTALQLAKDYEDENAIRFLESALKTMHERKGKEESEAPKPPSPKKLSP